ncbi:MAG: hypothetical protein ACI8VT_003593 [Saprospiraceae bacterium]|jgi:hypothetical protein
MRKPVEQPGADIPTELLSLYKRIDCNASSFGMSPSEVAFIKKECKIAFQHKTVLDKIAKKKK